MCGIVGGFASGVKPEEIKSMVGALKHRGPDDDGFFIDEDIFLGHTRLSIIDLSEAGSQPMSLVVEGKEFCIIFNGEIYNYKEIREELVEKGCEFKSDSDTEVVLRSYIEWGKESIQKFRGMFAFAIWDAEKKELFVCRDRFGVKPLYYFKNSDDFLFTSELKSLFKYPGYHKKINNEALEYYLRLGYIPAPYTIFDNTYKLEPGTFISVNSNGQITKERYWKAEDYFVQDNRKKEISESVEEELEKVLLESFNYRMVADVDVGVFLSGGIDSSLVVALLQKNSDKKIKTFTLGFNEKKYNEANHAKEVAKVLGTDHYEFYVSAEEAYSHLEDYTNIFDEPFGDSSGLSTYFLSKYTREHVKVALSGDGGDELFAGYTKYKAVQQLLKMSWTKKKLFSCLFSILNPAQIDRVYRFLSKFLPLPEYSNLREKLSKLSAAIKGKNLSDIFMLAGSYWLGSELDSLLLQRDSSEDTMSQFYQKSDLETQQQMSLWDLQNYLPNDILVKTDRTTMSVGLEGREPFLDPAVLEFAAKVNHEPGSKSLLKKVLFKHLDSRLFDRPKTGFNLPVYKWLKTEYWQKKMGELLGFERIKKQGIFDPEYIANLVDRFNAGKYVNPDKLWLLIIFQMWFDKWND